MISAIQYFFNPNPDFFGPEGGRVTCPILQDTPDCPLIMNCMNGVKLARAIDEIALERASSKGWPEWQKNDGSIIFDKLPNHIKSKFEKASELLDNRGFIKISQLHVIDREMLEQASKSRLGPYPGARYKNQCPCCRDENNCKELGYSRALHLRMILGPKFDAKNCKEFLSEKPQAQVSVREFQPVGDVIAKRADLQSVWKRVGPLAKGLALGALAMITYASSSSLMIME